ncbi:hypothetical protein ACFWUU_17795 [Kribbella sp. NPDC058693]|uniref:hypothetical protein n=1 Tax=Kribbella sp. NPDC058693 TaxID=3346602 RepID=UPI00364A160F
MSGDEHEFTDDAGLSDESHVLVYPETAEATAEAFGAGVVVVRVTTTATGQRGPGPTTTMGYPITKTYTIHESEAVDGVIQYELLEDGQVVWVGTGDDRVDGLLQVIMSITGEGPEVPDN